MALGISKVISTTLKTSIERFGPLLGMWAVFFGIQLLLYAIFFGLVGATGAMGFATGNVGAFGGGLVVAMILFYLAYFLVFFAQSAALYSLASPLRYPNFGESFNIGFRSALTLLGVFLLLAVAFMIAFFVIGLLAAALAFAGEAASAVLAILIVPLFVYVMCRLSVVYPVVAVERISNPISAITRGWALSRGHALQIFLILLLFVIFAIILIAIATVPFMALITSSMTGGAVPNFGGLGLLLVGFFIIVVLLSIVGAVILSVLHAEVAGSRGQDASEVFS